MTTLTGPVPLSDDHPGDLLNRSITPPLQTGGRSLEDVYEVERTRWLLKEGKFRSVALQFPDDMLHDAASLAQMLQKDAEHKTYILADTSYGRYLTLLGKGRLTGSCCVDEVAAEHVQADVVVHYGRACLSPYSPAHCLALLQDNSVACNICLWPSECRYRFPCIAIRSGCS